MAGHCFDFSSRTLIQATIIRSKDLANPKTNTQAIKNEKKERN